MDKGTRTRSRTGVPVIRSGAPGSGVDQVVVEEPLEVRLDGERVVVMMRTPGEDEALAAGFLRSESILCDRTDLVAIESVKSDESVWIDVRTRPGSSVLPEGWQHRLLANAACGLCGKTTIEAVRLELPERGPVPRVSGAVLAELPGRLAEHQPVFTATGGIHAAALFDTDGNVLRVSEDVGRHNAVDKVIGHAFLEGSPPLDETILLVSGRAGFEIVQKATVVGIRIVAAISAPSSLAVDLAREAGLVLVAFLRDGRYNIYAGGDAIG